MYYITKKKSATGQKFHVVNEKMKAAFEAQCTIASEYGILEWRQKSGVVRGGFSSVRIEGQVDTKVWKPMTFAGAKNEYMPRKRGKGLEIQKQFDQMTVVSPWELNDVVGANPENPFNFIGFAMTNKVYFGFHVPDQWNVVVPDDCEEVTYQRYNRLFNI